MQRQLNCSDIAATQRHCSSDIAATGYVLQSCGAWAFGYDAENRLTSACKPAVSGTCPSPTVNASYKYDPLGRRVEKSGAGVIKTWFVNDGSDEIAEYGSGNKVEGPYTYDPYGNCFSSGSPCSSSGEPYRFTGRRLDPETGLLYYRARYYSPVIGRFLQTDPVGYTADLNLYTYVGNDPTNRTDPTGEMDDVTFDAYAKAVSQMSPQEQAGLAVAGAIAATGGLGAIVLTESAAGAASAGAVVAGESGAGAAGARAAAAGGAAGLKGELRVSSPKEAPVNAQKQAGHTPGTPQNANRISQGKPTSTFFDKTQGENLTRDTHQTGTPVPGRPGVTEKDYGHPVGTGPKGGTQNRVRVHEDQSGQIHGHPCGPETPCR